MTISFRCGLQRGESIPGTDRSCSPRSRSTLTVVHLGNASDGPPAWRCSAHSCSPRARPRSPGTSPGRSPRPRRRRPRAPTRSATQSYADDPPAGGPRIEFGIGPRLAGEAGSGQTTPVVAEDKRKRDAALERLRGKRPMRVRLNRLFQADGKAGIERFERMARHYASLGFDVEIQVRYHPAPDRDGDIGAWLDYVRRVVRAFGPIKHVVSLQITNEVNISFSPNTSDGAYANAVRGAGARRAGRQARGRARRLRPAHHRLQLRLALRRRRRGLLARRRRRRRQAAAPRHGLGGRRRLPGHVRPADDHQPRRRAARGRRPGARVLHAARRPRAPDADPPRGARLPHRPRPHRGGRRRLRSRRSSTRCSRYRGTYGITNANWFGLRDNNSAGPDFQSFFGLLRDDYSPKPAFGEYKRLIRELSAR